MFRKRHRRLGLESLERRTLLAADLLNGTLSIVGTAGNDDIEVQVAVGGAHAGELQVDVNGEQSFFDVAQVSSIRISGLAGHDDITLNDNVLVGATINGGKGHDSIKGGAGNDTIHGDAGHDTIDGGAGNDTVFGDQGNDDVHGDDGNDTVRGNSGQDRLWGDAGDDELFGDNGKDTLDGGDDNDTCHGGNGLDTVRGDDGDDHLFGDNGSDALWGEGDNDYLDGGNGSDDCRGGIGDDELKGGRGRDRLDGGAGNNLIDSDNGNDIVSNGLETELDGELRAVMLGPNNESATAEYDVQNAGGDLKTEFSVKVDDLTPLTAFDVIIDGVTVGQITTNLSGDGEIKFSSNPNGGEVAFPVNFPTIEEGSTILIGNLLQGTFVKWHWT